MPRRGAGGRPGTRRRLGLLSKACRRPVAYPGAPAVRRGASWLGSGLSPGWGLTGVGKGHWLGLAMDGKPEAGRGLGPRFGREPEATPEPAAREQVAQPLEAEPEEADPSWTRRGRRARRRSQPARWAAGPVGLLGPRAVRGRPQRGDRQHEPVPRHAGRVGARVCPQRQPTLLRARKPSSTHVRSAYQLTPARSGGRSVTTTQGSS